MPEHKESPILFAGEMVRAILAGRKTQTRRVVKASKRDADGICIIDDKHAYNLYEDGITDADGMEWPILCPHGYQGDRLWVRETWRLGAGYQDLTSKEIREFAYGIHDMWQHVHYRAEESPHDDKWRSPYHMPRWASRIILEVTEVRLQQVKEISEGDAQAEGCEPKRIRVQDLAAAVYGGPRWINAMSYVHGFADLWNSLNAKRGYGLDTNPWVWAISFKRVESTDG